MPTKPLAELSNEALLKQKKTLKVAFAFTAVAAVLLFATGIWLTVVKHKFSALTVLPISIGIMAMANAKNLKAVQDELKLRG